MKIINQDASELRSINPTTEVLIQDYKVLTQEEINTLLSRAARVFQDWRYVPLEQRLKYMAQLKHQLLEQKHELANLITTEMGKPFEQAIAEIEKCTTICDYYIKNASRILANTLITEGSEEGYVTYQPLGVILGIMPWNFPFWQVIRYAVPALIAGNTTLLKHASNVTGCSLAIEKLFRDAGFPKGIFASLLIDSRSLAPIIGDKRIQAITLTGSTQAGRAVATLAGQHLKKCVLELGGSDAYIILEDADLEASAALCMKGRIHNAGQSCISAKRFIVVESIRHDFEQLMYEQFDQVTYGDPMTGKYMMGPLARLDLRDDLHDQVVRSVDKGATLLIGGQIPQIVGAYYPATILTNVQPGMPAYSEELFGPVASIIPAKDEEEAIRIANDSQFGLGAAIFTNDERKGKAIAEQKLEAGSCFVNNIVHSDSRFPFGGIKNSGYGRELGEFGIREFVNIKTIRVWSV